MKKNCFELFEMGIKSIQTKRVYASSLNEFMRFLNIKEYHNIPSSTNKIQSLLEDWVMSLIAKKEPQTPDYLIQATRDRTFS